MAVLFWVPLVDRAAKAPWEGVQSAGKMVRSAEKGVLSAGKAVQSAERRRRRVRMKEAVLRAHSSTRDPFTEIKCEKIYLYETMISETATSSSLIVKAFRPVTAL